MNGIGKGSDCGRIRKEKSKHRRLWGEGMRVRGWMNAVVGVRRLLTDVQRKSKNGRLWGEGMRVRRKINGVGKRSGLRMDPERKEQKWEVMG